MEKNRVSVAIAHINEALRLGNITEDYANKLKTTKFSNRKEFDRLYKKCESLNRAHAHIKVNCM